MKPLRPRSLIHHLASPLLIIALSATGCFKSDEPRQTPNTDTPGAQTDKAKPRGPLGDATPRGKSGDPGGQTHGDKIVYQGKDGAALTLEELELFALQAQSMVPTYELNVPGEARDFYKQGQIAGTNQKYQEAVNLFIESSLKARHWPAPVYGAAWAYLLQGKMEESISAYEAIDNDLAPRGYKNTKMALDTLKRESEGKVPPATYMRYELKMANEAPAGKIKALRQILDEAPAFPGAWNTLSTLLKDPAEQLDAIEQGLSHDPDAETRGQLLVNKAILLFDKGQKEEAINLAGALAADPTVPLRTEFMAKLSLLRFVKPAEPAP